MTNRSAARLPRRISRPLTLALYVGTALSPVYVPPASAQSDQDIRHMTVLQRPRDTYDPRGIPIGAGFTFLPSVTATETYDDNIFGLQNTTSDFITIVRPEVELRSNWSRHSLDFTAYGRFNRYMDHTDQNSDEYGANLNAGLDLAHAATLNLMGSYDRLTVDRNSPDATKANLTSAEQVDITQGTATYSQTFSHLLLGASAHVVNWQEVRETDKVKNRNEYTGSVRAGYVFSPALNVFVEPAYTIRDFEVRPSLADPTDRNSDILTISAGVGYDITGVLYGETTVGWYDVNFADSRFKNATGISIRSDTTYNVTARDSFILTIQRTSDVATQTPGASSNQRTSVTLQAQHELLRNVVLQADVGYADEDYVDSVPHQDDSVYTAGVQGTYYLDRHFSVYAAYNFFKRDSNIPAVSYDDNRIGVGIKVQL